MLADIGGLTATPAVLELRPEDVYPALGSSPAGLTSDEAARRLAEIGPNRIARAGGVGWWLKFGSHFVHVMAVLLWVGGAVAFLARLPELGVAIWVVNVVNGLFSFWQEHKAEKATEALMRLLPSTATVLRDGAPALVDFGDLVPGDVVVIAEGDRISADGRLTEHVTLRVDQSALTGESRLVRKAADPVADEGRAGPDCPNMVFAGSGVASGRGKFVVTATGSKTEFGVIAQLTESMVETPSPLQVELRRVSVTVSIVATSVGLVFFALAMSLGGMPPARGLVFALGMIVAFVPEGLLPTVTLALAMSTQRMAKRHALVKRLSAVETLGSTTVICTDKTGTLTQNEMTVRTVYSGGKTYDFQGVGYSPEGSVTPAPTETLRLLLTTAALASNARLIRPDEGRWSIVGDPTEGALLVAAEKTGIDVDALTKTHARVAEVPFDSNRKRMSAVTESSDGLSLSTKGAPAELLARCDRWLTDDGSEPLDDHNRDEILGWVDLAAREGLRVLGVARRTVDAIPGEEEDVERELEFLGLTAMLDPPRPEVKRAVETCRKAGIRIVMITGDYGVTAEAIGRRIGMIDRVRVVTGDELREISDDELQDILDGEVLFARTSSVDKLRVVAALQDKGEVVAVTGDGVNDAPALKKADIGVAMGRSGTDVAKEAADMVLLDDNFASIVAAIEEGRAVYDNIKRFTTYILTSNVPEAIPFVVFAFSGGRIPIALGVMHILAIDLGTDLVPALALGAEPPDPGVMSRPPRPAGSHLIDRPLLIRAYLWLGPLQAVFVMVMFFLAYRLMGVSGWADLPDVGPVYRAATAMALAAVVATQIGNLYTQRASPASRIQGEQNKLIWWGIASEVLVILAIVYLPFLADVIGTAPFPAAGWLWLLAGVPLLPLAEALRRRIWPNSRRG